MNRLISHKHWFGENQLGGIFHILIHIGISVLKSFATESLATEMATIYQVWCCYSCFTLVFSIELASI